MFNYSTYTVNGRNIITKIGIHYPQSATQKLNRCFMT